MLFKILNGYGRSGTNDNTQNTTSDYGTPLSTTIYEQKSILPLKHGSRYPLMSELYKKHVYGSFKSDKPAFEFFIRE